MTSKELRKKFLDFFEKKGHRIVLSSSLIPSDSSVLFTTAGMQQFKKYYLGEKSPYNNKIATCQKCFRTSDIEEVGDEKHLTFLEMLGNFSFGDYFKEEAISAAYELLNSELKIQKSKMTITVFGGDANVPRDEESAKIWGKLGFSERNGNLRFVGREDNFWGPTGEEGPCGPTTEIIIKETEIWNLVFNQYYQDKDKKLTPLIQFGVDTGMGLERLAMIVQGESSVFTTDLFIPIIQEIERISSLSYELQVKSFRIIADHIKSAVFLISEDIFPSNLERGYVLRRILRRMIRYGKILNQERGFLVPLAKKVIEIYKMVYPELKSKETDILTVIQNEEEKFEKTLAKGLRQFDKLLKSLPAGRQEKSKIVEGKEAFDLYQSYGFPLELIEQLAKEKGYKIDKEDFNKAFEEHQEISRRGAEKKFGGVGKEAGYESAKLHTATHLLHAALRKILGNHIRQMGSDIIPARLRFDFSHNQKMTSKELKQVEDLVNQKIKEDLIIKKEEMSLKNALESGALSFFKEKYPEKVSVYTIFNPKTGEVFSKEICAGPHINKTSELGYFKIIKEESSGANIRRIKAII